MRWCGARAATAGNLAAVVVIAVCSAACGGGPGTFARSHLPKGAETIVVSVGGDESAGIAVSDPEHDDWPQLFYRQAFSERSTLYELASPEGVRVENLLGGEAAQVSALRPRVVTLWVGLDDLLDGLAPATFRQSLEQALSALRSRGATVLVANLLPVYRFPGYSTCRSEPVSCGIPASSLPSPGQLASEVAVYDAAINGAASARHASVVNLTGIFASRGVNGTGGLSALTDTSDLGLTAAGEQVVAGAFERAYSASGR